MLGKLILGNFILCNFTQGNITERLVTIDDFYQNLTLVN